MHNTMKSGFRIAAAIALGLGVALASSTALAQEEKTSGHGLAEKLAPERAAKLAGQWCSSCHGRGGVSVAPTFPILAGQSPEYIVTELMDFHNLSQDDRAITHETMFEQWITNITGLRRNYRYEDAPRNEPRAWDFMKGVARDLDMPTMKALADYYSKQTPAPGRGGAEGDIARGKTLFQEGDAGKGLIACQMCHGPDAKGQGPIPRLAGQHADYVKVQLQFIKSGLRNVEQMQALIANLDDNDFAAVAAYVQSLN